MASSELMYLNSENGAIAFSRQALVNKTSAGSIDFYNSQ